jgi:hypothetical protein
LFEESAKNPNLRSQYNRETEEEIFFGEKSPRVVEGYYFHVQRLLKNPEIIYFDGADRKFDLRFYNFFLFIPKSKTIYNIYADRADWVDIKFAGLPFKQVYDLSEKDRQNYNTLKTFMKPNLTNVNQVEPRNKQLYNPTMQQHIDEGYMKEEEFPPISSQVQGVLKIIMPHFAEKILHECFSSSGGPTNSQPQV